MKFEEWIETIPHAEMGKYELAQAAFDAASQKKAIDETDEYEDVEGSGC